MKESIFNYYTTINNKNYLYNSNNAGLLELPVNDLNDEEIKYLQENRFYIEEEEDEVKTLEDEVNSSIRIGSRSLELTIALTNQCNFRCAYCYQDKNQKVMSIQTADHIIRKIRNVLAENDYEEIWIHYFGGEPLLNIPILKYLDGNIRCAAEENKVVYHTYLTTNGSMLSDDILSSIKFENIQLTFDGEEVIHDSLRISDQFHFQDEITLLKKIIDTTSARIILRMNACLQNKNEILRFYQSVLENHGYERFDFNLNRMIKYHDDDNFEMLTQAEYAKLYYDLQRLIKMFTGKTELPIPRKIPCKFTCGIAYAISPDGYCNFCSGSVENGKILFQDVDIAERKEIRFREECKTCICLPLCLGGCIVQHNLQAGCCSYEKFCLDEIIKDYVAKTEAS
ncbi:MAG: radical SAM protein [Lachnospiraceae bacterium]|nr:radical SAM protein [Lachnospiraceae bacterium]